MKIIKKTRKCECQQTMNKKYAQRPHLIEAWQKREKDFKDKMMKRKKRTSYLA